jgi:SHS2 domain-containing protein
VKEFELIEHTADLKIRVYGKTLQDLFIHALRGMFQSLDPISPLCVYNNGNFECTRLTQKHSITLDAPDISSLLVDFLSEALYLSDTLNEAYFDAIIAHLTEHHIEVEILGVPITGFEVVEIKAVTYHDLNIKQINGIWQTDIVFDI